MIHYHPKKKRNVKNIIKNDLINYLLKGNKNEEKKLGNIIKIDIITQWLQ